MKKMKRLIAFLLTIIMMAQPLVFAAETMKERFPDFPDNWATEAMTAAVNNGLLKGNEVGMLHPDRNLTRAEFAAIIVRAFGATVEADISNLTDVKKDDWFYSEVAKAYQMQVMNGVGKTEFSPNASITRQEVFVVLSRALCLPDGDVAVLEKFSDKDTACNWATPGVAAIIENGYISGYPDGTLKPCDYITRAELAQMFHNIFKTYISEKGTYSKVAEKGSVIVRAPGVKLQNVTINGDLIIADGVGNGNFDLSSVKVNGRILFRGGEGKVTLRDLELTKNIVVNDVNGTVNFNNYRDDQCFNDIILNTPATFLTRGGGGGGGYVSTTKTVEFSVTAPVAGATAQTTVSGQGYSDAAITWSPALLADGTFDYSTAYTATFTLNLKTGYKFASSYTIPGATSVTVSGKTVTVVFPATADRPVTPETEIAFSVTAPVAGATAQMTVSGEGYSDATITWSPALLAGNVFDYSTVYTATFTLNLENGYKFADSYGSNVTVNGNTVTIVFPATADRPVTPETEITFSVTAPVAGATAQMTVSGEGYSDAAITWSPALLAGNVFDYSTVYTATFTLNLENGYKFADSYGSNVTVNGNTVTIVFPATEDKTVVEDVYQVVFYDIALDEPKLAELDNEDLNKSQDGKYTVPADKIPYNYVEGIAQEGFVKDGQTHKISMGFWILENGEWTAFNEETILKPGTTNVFVNVRKLDVEISVPKLSGIAPHLSVWYEDEDRMFVAMKDLLFANENMILNSLSMYEEQVLEKISNKGIIDEDGNIKNIDVEIKFKDVIGKDERIKHAVEDYIWEYIGKNLFEEADSHSSTVSLYADLSDKQHIIEALWHGFVAMGGGNPTENEEFLNSIKEAIDKTYPDLNEQTGGAYEQAYEDFKDEFVAGTLTEEEMPESFENFADAFITENEETGEIDKKELGKVVSTVAKEMEPEALEKVEGTLIDKGIISAPQEGEASLAKKSEMVKLFISELCEGENLTLRTDSETTFERKFLFERFYSKLEGITFETFEAKLPENVKKVIPLSVLEELFDAIYGEWLDELAAAMDRAENEASSVPARIVIKLNPVTDVFEPVVEFYYDKFEGVDDDNRYKELYNEFIGSNADMMAIKDYFVTENGVNTEMWLDDGLNTEGYTGYKLYDVEYYYGLVQELSVLADDAAYTFYTTGDEAKRDELIMKLLDKGIIIKDLFENGIPSFDEIINHEIVEDKIPQVDKISDKYTAMIEKVYNKIVAKIADLGLDEYIIKATDFIPATEDEKQTYMDRAETLVETTTLADIFEKIGENTITKEFKGNTITAEIGFEVPVEDIEAFLESLNG